MQAPLHTAPVDITPAPPPPPAAFDQDGRPLPPPMPPPPPPSGQAVGEAYNPAPGQYLSFQQLPMGEGKDRTAMMGLGPGNSQSKTPGSTRGMIKAKRTPGTGRGRRAKNGDVRTTKKVCIDGKIELSKIMVRH